MCPPTLEPHLLQITNLLIEALVLKPVSVHLRLVILEFSNHVSELFGAILQVLLIDLELVGYLGPALLGEYVFQLDVEFLLLLNEDVLLGYLLCLGNQALLQRLNLLDQLVCFRIGALELPPAMHIQRLL